MEHSTSSWRRMGLNMNKVYLMFMSKMDSLNVISNCNGSNATKNHLACKGFAKILVGRSYKYMHVLNRTVTWVLDGLIAFEKWIRDKLNISHS
jgi:hypothetical protein